MSSLPTRRKATVRSKGGRPIRRAVAPQGRPRRLEPTTTVTQSSANPMRSSVPTTRVRFLALGWLVVVVVVFARMATLQLVHPEAAVEKGLRQRIRFTRLAAERGDLVDRTGVPLAISVREWRVVADPSVLVGVDRNAYAGTIGRLLNVDEALVKPRLIGTTHYAVVARGLDEPAADRIRSYKPHLDGIYLEEEPRRVYPAGDLARGILGRVNRATEAGETGLEKQFEDQLRGKPGELLVERGAKGRQIAGTPQKVLPPVRGETYELTIDRALTYSVEGMLATSIAITGSKSGMVLVTDPRTGDILVMANMAVDSKGNVVNTEHNCALVCVYEPGSVNKAITIAAALEEGIVSPSTRFSVPDHLQVSDHRFKDDEPHKTVSWTPGEILANSSNIGTIRIAQAVGKNRLDQYLRGFGLGHATGIDFPGESAGIVPKLSHWTGTSIGTVPIGQGLAVTAGQMMDVYNTVANGGVRVPLRLVRGTVDARGVTHDLQLAKSTRVVSATTATRVTEMLADVVYSGTGTAAHIDGYTVAGKTGTAQKADGKGGYLRDGYVASFAGFFPAEHPALSAIVILDEPKTSIYGGQVAAPLFSEVGRFAAGHFRLAPSAGLPPLSNEHATDVTATREALAARTTGTWQQALIRRAALSTAPLDASFVSPPAENRSSSPSARPPTDGSNSADKNHSLSSPGSVAVGQVERLVAATTTSPASTTTIAPTSTTQPKLQPAVPDVSRRAKPQTVRPRAVSVKTGQVKPSAVADGGSSDADVAKVPMAALTSTNENHGESGVVVARPPTTSVDG